MVHEKYPFMEMQTILKIDINKCSELAALTNKVPNVKFLYKTKKMKKAVEIE